MENSLIKNNLRSVISLVDKLRDIGLDSYIQLPKIVAVGSQSSGKSSLIQQVVGLDFLPRGSGVVTRRPLQIRMVYQEGLKQSYAHFQQIPNQKFTDFSKVKNAIEQLTDKVCGKNKNIVDKAIVLYVYSSHCPNLTVIDLPGLTRISLESQVTKNMIKKYMEQENTIILCVIPANQDITNDQVLHMARQIDAKGERTIGCITKIDIMDRGTDARSLLMNKGEVPLRLGYVGIKNRSQADINQNKTVKQSLEQQKMFFSKSPIYSSLPLSCLGTTSLVQKMTKVLQSCIVNYLPTLLQKIREKKHNLSEIIKQYGKPLPKTLQERQGLIWELCSQYILNYKNSIKGIPSTLQCSDRIQKVSAHINQQLRQILQQQSQLDFSDHLKDTKIAFALKKFDTINQLGFPSMNAFLYLINPLLNHLKHPMENTLAHVCDNMQHLSQLISSEVAHEYIEFREYLNGKVLEIITEFKRKCNQYLLDMLECEIKGIEYQKLLFDRSRFDTSKYTEIELRNPLIPVLRRSVINYYQRCVKNLRQLVPKNITYLILNEAVKKIQFQIFQTCAQSSSKVEKWLEISSHSKQERLRNQKQFEVIQKAQQHILTYGGFSKAVTAKRNKKRQQREKQMEEVMLKRKLKQKKQQQKLASQQAEKILKTPQKQQKSQKPQKAQSKFDFWNFGSKPQYTAPKPDSNAKIAQKQPPKQKQYPKQQKYSKQKHPNKPQPKANVFAQLFGTTQVKKQQKSSEPKQEHSTSQRKPIFNQPPKQDQPLKNKYNQEMGKATDKGVDELFKNQKFQQQSKKAVQKGSATAFQKQFGTSQKTANLFGQGAGWVWGQEKTQNLAKDQAKKTARDKTQW